MVVAMSSCVAPCGSAVRSGSGYALRNAAGEYVFRQYGMLQTPFANAIGSLQQSDNIGGARMPADFRQDGVNASRSSI